MSRTVNSVPTPYSEDQVSLADKYCLRYDQIGILPSMRAFALLCSVCCVAFNLVTLPAATPRMPVAEIHAGMTGTGFTVFEGTTREAFQVDVLGVLANARGPRRSLIIARLKGGPLAETGVIQGMSGSPVYIDDRLIGAVSYSLGSFSKDAIAGITPIEEMVATDETPIRSARRRPVPLPLTPARDGLFQVVRRAFERAQPFANHPIDIASDGVPILEAGRLGTLLRPIATPLVLTGFVPEIHELWASSFDSVGFVTTVGGSATTRSTQTADDDTPLQPGDAVGVSLIRGDLTVAGTGTVTMVEDNRVYAFGHPFYNLGLTRFPMTRAHITTLLPSLAISSKIAAIGDVLGTIDQDRATGIYGSLGTGPELIPVTVRLRAGDRNLEQRFDLEIVEDAIFTPLLLYTSLLNTFFSWTGEFGASTYVIDGRARLRGNTDVTFHNIYTGPTAGITASASIAVPLTSLLDNVFEPITFDGIEINITSYEEPRTATLERVWIDTARPRAGETIPLKVLSRSYRGAKIVETVMLKLPPHVTGPLQVLVSDAAQLIQRETQQGRQVRQAKTLDQMIRALNTIPRNNRLYVKLMTPSDGAVVRGETLPALPASVLSIFEGDAASGNLIRLRQATIGEWEIPSDYLITGSRLLNINVEGG